MQTKCEWATVKRHITNQDWGAADSKHGIIVVADGTSSGWKSEIAARAAASKFIEWAKGLSSVSTENLPSQITEVFEEIVYVVRRDTSEDPDTKTRHPDIWPQTTLVGVVCIENKLIITYTGDGWVWVARGGNEDNDILRLLLPDSSRSGELKGLINPGSPEPPRPVLLILENIKAWSGGLFVVVSTDGVTWIENREYLFSELRDVVREELKQNRQWKAENVKRKLEAWIEKRIKDDDATIGILLTPEILENWQSEDK